jgi:hypothetical protein
MVSTTSFDPSIGRTIFSAEGKAPKQTVKYGNNLKRLFWLYESSSVSSVGSFMKYFSCTWQGKMKVWNFMAMGMVCENPIPAWDDNIQPFRCFDNAKSD